MGLIRANKIKGHQVHFCLGLVEIEVVGRVECEVWVFGMIKNKFLFIELCLSLFLLSDPGANEASERLGGLLNLRHTSPISFP